MRTDGYNPEIVFDKLQWPHAITIDYARTMFDEILLCLWSKLHVLRHNKIPLAKS